MSRGHGLVGGAVRPDVRFEAMKHNKLRMPHKRTIVVDDMERTLYCLDAKGKKKPVLPLDELITTSNEGLRMDLHFGAGLKVYKFTFADSRELDRFWVTLQRYCKEPSAPPEADSGKLPGALSELGDSVRRMSMQAFGRKAGAGMGASSASASSSHGETAAINPLLAAQLAAKRQSIVGVQRDTGASGPASGAAMSGASAPAAPSELDALRQLPAPAGSVAEFAVVKLSRYGEQNRVLALLPDRKVLQTLDQATGALAKEFEMSGIRGLQRLVSNPRRLHVQFSDSRDYIVQFASAHERESFCALLSALRPKAALSWDTETREGQYAAIYDVQVVLKSGLRKRRTLLIERDKRTISRLRSVSDALKVARGDASWEGFTAKGDAHGAAGPPPEADEWAGSSTKRARRLVLSRKHGKPPQRVDHRLCVDAHETDKRRLKLKFETEDGASGPATLSKKSAKNEWLSTDIIFGSPDQRERFAGQLRAFHAEATRNATSEADRVMRSGVEVHTVTWNVGERKPPEADKLARLLPAGRHLYVVGLQECEHKDLYVKAIVGHVGDNYDLVATSSLWGIHCIVVVLKTLMPRISHVHTSKEATGLGNVLGNKGGAAVAFTIQEDTRVAFVVTHLAARVTRVMQRGQNYSQIVRKLRLGQPRGVEFLHHYHHVFWIGDLNYRVDRGAHGTPEEFAHTVAKAEAGDLEELLAHDQLMQQRQEQKAFFSFQEAPIKFAPTYRMLKGEVGYSNKKCQNPSWTDRILWRSHPGVESHVAMLAYEGVHDIITSDHRPVMATFALIVMPNYCIAPPPPTNAREALRSMRMEAAQQGPQASDAGKRDAAAAARKLRSLSQEADRRGEAGARRRFSMTTTGGSLVDELADASFQSLRLGFTHIHFEAKQEEDPVALLDHVDPDTEWAEDSTDGGAAGGAGGGASPSATDSKEAPASTPAAATADDDDVGGDDVLQRTVTVTADEMSAALDRRPGAKAARRGADTDSSDSEGDDASLDAEGISLGEDGSIRLSRAESERRGSRFLESLTPNSRDRGNSVVAPIGDDGSDEVAPAEGGELVLDGARLVEEAHRSWQGAQLSVVISADFIESSVSTKPSTVQLGDAPTAAAAGFKRPHECNWTSAEIPLAIPFIPDRRHLFFRGVRLVVRRHTGSVAGIATYRTVGQTELGLQELQELAQPIDTASDPALAELRGCDINGLHTMPFTVPLMLSGRPAGSLSGRLVLYGINRASTALRRLANFRALMTARRRGTKVGGGFFAKQMGGRFPPAQLGMADDIRHTLERTVVRVWRDDAKALIPQLSRKQILMLANLMYGGGFEMSDSWALIMRAVEDGSSHGSKALLLDFGAEVDAAAVWDLVWRFHLYRTAHEGTATTHAPEPDAGDDSEGLSSVDASRLTLFLTDTEVPAASDAEVELLRTISEPQKGILQVLEENESLYLTGDQFAEWLQSREEDTAVGDAETAQRVTRRLVRLGLLVRVEAADAGDDAASASSGDAVGDAASVLHSKYVLNAGIIATVNQQRENAELAARIAEREVANRASVRRQGRLGSALSQVKQASASVAQLAVSGAVAPEDELPMGNALPFVQFNAGPNLLQTIEEAETKAAEDARAAEEAAADAAAAAALEPAASDDVAAGGGEEVEHTVDPGAFDASDEADDGGTVGEAGGDSTAAVEPDAEGEAGEAAMDSTAVDEPEVGEGDAVDEPADASSGDAAGAVDESQ